MENTKTAEADRAGKPTFSHNVKQYYLIYVMFIKLFVNNYVFIM